MKAGAVCGALAAIGVVARWAWRVNRRGVRIYELVTELSPNSGHSVKDKVDTIQAAVTDLADEQRALGARLDAHLADHRRPLWRRR
ncbi:hypothetical protein [Streptomyces sp. UG1]|uniref:hypothetical protein n=1 Tax=Streptomyces sp. UG1 TaxID=3417652 RepID=UPI003CF570A2